MHSLSSEDSLRIWEHAHAALPVTQALAILQVAIPEYEYDTLVDLPVGERDRLLLLTRQATFGDWIEAYDECPSCSEGIEYSFTVTEILAGDSDPDEPRSLELDNFKQSIELAPLTTRDLLAVTNSTESDPLNLLLESSVLPDASKDWIQGLDLEQQQNVCTKIEAHLEAIDPLSNISFLSTCPECSHSWEAPFDIGSFLWKEISIDAKRLLSEIHILANRYGWTETDILKLSKNRRQLYVNLSD